MYINGVYINPLHAAGVFIIILFIYIQIQYYYKIAPDENANIYELTQELPKKQFDKVCDSDRIPFVFTFVESPAVLRFMAATDFTTCSTVPIHIRQGTGAASAAAGFKTIPFIRGMELMSGAIGPAPQNVVTERNSELLKALHISAFLKRRDAYLRPALCQYIDYDLLMGAPRSATPLRYEINQRTFFMVTEGVAYIRLVHPDVAASEFRPNEEADIDNRLMEYRSQANLWNVRTAQRIPCMHLTIKAGQTVYIPPFWWYSIQFVQGPGTRVLRFSYRSIINSLVLSPYFIAHKMYAFSDGDSTVDVAPVTKTSVGSIPSKSALKKKSRKRNVTFAGSTESPPLVNNTVPASMAGTPDITPITNTPPAPVPAPAPTDPVQPNDTTPLEGSAVPATLAPAAAAEQTTDTTPLAAPASNPAFVPTSPPPPVIHPSGFVIPLHAPMPDPLPQPAEPPKNAKSPNLERLLKQMEEMGAID